MQRPLLKWLIFWISGLIISLYLNLSKSIIIVLGIIIVIIAIVILLVQIRDKNHFLILVLIFLVSLSYLQLEKISWEQTELKKLLGNKNKFRGVISKVLHTKYNTSYIIKDLKAVELKENYNYKLRLTTWHSTIKLNLGDEILFTTILERPMVQKNPGGFSYRNYLRKKKIYAIGNLEKENILKVTTSRNLFINLINKLRNIIKKRIQTYFKGTNQKLITALLLGLKETIPSKVSKEFNQLGISHLLVVSGFHVGLISYLFYSLVNYLGFSERFNFVINTVVLICYLAIINWQLPALRATLLIILVLLAKILDRKIDLYNLLAGIALILLILDPWSLFAISFQLSFGAVIMINYLSPIIKEYLSFLPNKISQICAATLAAQIGLLPVLIYYFHQISLLSVVANLILMPVISFVLMLILFFLFLSIINFYCAQFIASLINCLLTFSLNLIQGLAQFNFQLRLSQPSLLLIFVYYILIYYLAKLVKSSRVPYDKIYYKKFITICLIAIIILVAAGFNNKDELEVVFLAVGLGDCTYIKTTNNKNILIDGGEKGNKLISFLKSRGISNLDLVFVSHFHNDHAGGILKVLEEFKVKKIFYPPTRNNDLKKELKRIISQKRKKVELSYLTAGDYVNINKINFLVLGPTRPLITENSLNNNSLILKIIYDQFQLLLTGDIEKEAEERLVNNNLNLDVDVLKLAHHGSNTSNTEVLLKRSSPSLSIMSVGNNNYGLPDYKVLRRLKKLQIKNLRTDKKGAIILKTDGKTYQYQSFLD